MHIKNAFAGLVPLVGIDVGSYQIRMVRQGFQEIYEDSNVFQTQNNTLIALGATAIQSFRNGTGQLVWPVKQSLVQDRNNFRIALVGHYKKYPHRPHFLKPRVIISCPTGASNLDLYVRYHAAREGLGGEVALMDDLTAIYGYYEPFHLMIPTPSIILHIGCGVTAIGVVTDAGLQYAERISFAGSNLDQLIQRLLFEKVGETIDIVDCQQIKHQVASLEGGTKSWEGVVRYQSGKTSRISIQTKDIQKAIEKGLNLICEEIDWYLKNLPIPILAETKNNATRVSGGSCYLPGIGNWFSNRYDQSFVIESDPDQVVIRGIQKVLGEFPKMKRLIEKK